MNKKRAKLVRDLFLRGATLSSEERVDWLDSVCGKDDALRSELTSLLEHHREATVFRDLPPSSEVRIDRTPGFARRSRWLEAPWRRVGACVLGLAVLSVIHHFSMRRMEASSRERVGAGLEAVLQGYGQAVVRWIDERKREVAAWAKDEALVGHVKQLVAEAQELDLRTPAGRDALRALGVHAEIQSCLKPRLAANADMMYTVLDDKGFVLSTIERFRDQYGLNPDEQTAAYVSVVFQGEVRFVPPGYFDDWFTGPMPAELIEEASSWCNAPIYDGDRAIAALGLGLPASYFDDIFAPGEFTEGADIYAFDAEGVLVSKPVHSTRLIPDGEAEGRQPWQRVRRVRDPGGDTTAGHVPALRPEVRPLTVLANAAITSRLDPDSERSGRVLEPYRDYRGVEVVGAWRWFEEDGLGLAAELQADEAFEPVGLLRGSFRRLYVALGAALVIAIWLAFRASSARAGARVKLGPYTLIRPIGEGGVGRVYLASHALLRRQTAVKLLREDQLSGEARARFEREVQLASQLEHPNTIQIHDYGHTPDGTFYYAMEYLKGETLAELVQKEGAMDPRRAVYVLQQVCGSLREAHARGLVHRDIKPQNVMLCTRAGNRDVVKVLDFGLAKDLESADERDFTRLARIAGTPLYMAPERIRDPRGSDRRVDVYAVGALAHFLLSGRRMFSAESDLALIEHVLRDVPAPLPSGGEGDPGPELAYLVARCLEKDPDARPESMGALLAALGDCPEAGAWQPGVEEPSRAPELSASRSAS